MKTFGDLPRDVVRARTLTSPATLLRLVVVAAEFVITSRIKLVPEKRKRRREREGPAEPESAVLRAQLTG